MRGLPNKWQFCKLEELTSDISYGYTAKSDAANGAARLLRITDIQNNNVDWKTVPFCEISPIKLEQYKLKQWDLVFARTGATVGKSFLIRGNIPVSVFASYLIRVRVLQDETISYLSRFFNSPGYWQQITEFSSGIGQPNVNGSKLKNLEIPLAPLAEQKRIADKLDTLLEQVDACRTRLDKIPVMMKRFRQAVLAAATSGKLTEDWRASTDFVLAGFSPREKTVFERGQMNLTKRAKIPVPLINEPLETLPVSWIWASIDESALKITDGTHRSPENLSSGDFKYVTSKNVREGYIDHKGITFVSKATHSEIYSRCDVQKNDVLFVKDGANTGLACVSPFEEQISLLSSVGVIRCSSFLHPKFLELVLNSPETRRRMLSEMSGNAIPRLTLTKIASSAIPIPPLAEQAEIIRRVETLFAFADRLEARYSAARAQVEQLTPALLAKAFRGELVEQDPEDEPASALLARIAQARPVPTSKRKKS